MKTLKQAQAIFKTHGYVIEKTEDILSTLADELEMTLQGSDDAQEQSERLLNAQKNEFYMCTENDASILEFFRDEQDVITGAFEKWKK